MISKINKKNFIKILFIFFILLTIIMAFPLYSKASEQMLNTFRTMDNVGDNTNTSDTAHKVMSTIVVSVQVVAIGIAIIVLVILAIKYMLASVNERAELKKSMTVYVIGAIIVFAATAIFNIISKFASII